MIMLCREKQKDPKWTDEYLKKNVCQTMRKIKVYDYDTDTCQFDLSDVLINQQDEKMKAHFSFIRMNEIIRQLNESMENRDTLTMYDVKTYETIIETKALECFRLLYPEYHAKKALKMSVDHPKYLNTFKGNDKDKLITFLKKINQYNPYTVSPKEYFAL